MTIIGQVAGPVTITGQVDLAFNPFEKRGKHGEWGAGAELKAHDTASATAKRDAAAKHHGLVVPELSPPVADVKEFWGSLSDNDAAVLQDYIGQEGSAAINGALRAGKMPGVGKAEPSDADMLAQMLNPSAASSGPTIDRSAEVPVLDRIIASHTVTKTTTLYRGMAMSPALAAQLKPGTVFTDKGFTSTSDSANWAGKFARLRVSGSDPLMGEVPALGGKPAVMDITVPAGSHMAPGDLGIKEYILPRGGSYRVDSISPDGGTYNLTALLPTPQQMIAGATPDNAVDVMRQLIATGMDPKAAGDAVSAQLKSQGKAGQTLQGLKAQGFANDSAGDAARAARLAWTEDEIEVQPPITLAYDPLERRGPGGEWGAGALLKAHDTASATASRDAKAKIAADHAAERGDRRAAVAKMRGVSLIREQADTARAARQRRYVGQKPAAGETFYLPDPDKHGQNVMVRAADEDGHVRVEDAAGRRTVLPAAFVSRPMAPNKFTGGPPPASSGLLLDPPIKAPAPSASGVEPADPADADDPVSRQLDADIASGIKEEETPRERAKKAGLKVKAGYFGNSAQTSVVTFGNGHQWVRKRGLSDSEMHNEVLASRISDVLGAGAPHVLLRDNPNPFDDAQEMWEPMVPNAEPAAAWISKRGGMDDAGEAERPEDATFDMVNSRQGAKIGLLDTITDNGDRHEGNWMVQHGPAGDTTPVPIDHGGALMDDGDIADAGGVGPFSRNLVGNGAESELLAMIPQQAWAKWDTGLAALEPLFEAYGMSDQFINVQDSLRNVAELSAEGKAEAPGTLGHPLIVDDPALWAGAAP